VDSVLTTLAVLPQDDPYDTFLSVDHHSTTVAALPQEDSYATFRSADGDPSEFLVNRKDLESAAYGFPPVDDTEGPITLPEPSSILKLLFRFIERKPPPDLENFPFVSLIELAEAAHKYNVHNAISICIIRMKYAASSLSKNTEIDC